jgi:uncharacterized protein YaaN involved in tellurite resistance
MATSPSESSLLPVAVEPTLPALQPKLAYALAEDRLLDLTKYSPEQRQRIEQIAAAVSFADTNSLLTFGAEPQRRLSGHLDELMGDIRSRDVGSAGDLTIELATTIKALHLTKMREEAEGRDWFASTLGGVPVVGKWFSSLRYLRLSYQRIKTHLEAIEGRAQQDVARLNAVNDKLDRMVEDGISNIKDLELYLAAAQVVIKRSRVEFEQQRLVAVQSKDPVQAARLRDFAEQLNAFETRVVRIHVAHGESMVAVPEIRASQAASRIAISGLMDSILFDLPHLKRAIVQVASLAQTAKALKANAARRELSRQISTIGAENLQATYLAAKQSQGGFEQDVAALAQAADKLLQTIELGRRLDADNARKREKAIADLSGVKAKFTQGLLASGDAFVRKS